MWHFQLAGDKIAIAWQVQAANSPPVGWNPESKLSEIFYDPQGHEINNYTGVDPKHLLIASLEEINVCLCLCVSVSLCVCVRLCVCLCLCFLCCVTCARSPVLGHLSLVACLGQPSSSSSAASTSSSSCARVAGLLAGMEEYRKRLIGFVISRQQHQYYHYRH